MIRLMLNPYSNEERRKLSRLLEEARQTVCESTSTCGDVCYCTACPYRHLCNDLMNASIFADEYKAPTK